MAAPWRAQLSTLSRPMSRAHVCACSSSSPLVHSLHSGEILTDEGKEKKVSIDFEPFRPVNTSLYLCDNKFHTEALSELLQDDKKFGFIIMDGNGSLFGTLQGSQREILHKFSVDLPKKHGRGGQSAARFARIRLEKRHNYVRRVAELAVTNFITADRPNVAGIVLAGSADFKMELQRSDLLDPRLAEVVIKLVDVSYGGEIGFNQAIELAADALTNVKFVHEKKVIQKFFDEIAVESGKYVYGVRDTLTALEMSSVETLLVWEDLDVSRLELRNTSSGEVKILHLRPEEEKDRSLFVDPETGTDLEVVNRIPMVEWLAENFKSFGARLEFVTDKSTEGSQFCKGFGGIGGCLRWKVDTAEIISAVDDEEFI